MNYLEWSWFGPYIRIKQFVVRLLLNVDISGEKSQDSGFLGDRIPCCAATLGHDSLIKLERKPTKKNNTIIVA